MPFVSKAQSKACWAQHSRDVKAGRTPKWNCKEWSKHTEYSKLPDKKARMTGGYVSTSLGLRKLRTGPRGGKYYIVNGMKKYIPA